MLVMLCTCTYSASPVLPTMYRSEWEEAVARRQSLEQSYLAQREQRIEENEAQLQHLRQHNMEEFNKIKIKLETDIQVLQQQIQQMKATFLLNAEKLEYNFQVREEERGERKERGGERKEWEEGRGWRGRRRESVEKGGRERRGRGREERRGKRNVECNTVLSLVLGAKFTVYIPPHAVALRGIWPRHLNTFQ